jgi:hypothetical protein
MTDTPSDLSRWQTPEGWPSDDYLAAVETALNDAGVTIKHWWRDEDYDAVLMLTAEAAASFGYVQAWVGWRVAEDSDPLADEWRSAADAFGWYLVPASAPQGPGDHVEEVSAWLFDDPADVADAVKIIVQKLAQR